MVFAKVGCAIGSGTVLLDAHTVHIEAAYDRPTRRARCEARTCYARLFKEEIAQGRGAVATQFIVGHDRDGGELIGDDRNCPDQCIGG
jgi:hypothetical protein